MKPSWKDAPEWANWLAMDRDGTWYWYQNRPNKVIDGFWPSEGRWEFCDTETLELILEKRPEVAK
jgi:hypothetical protein